MRSRIVIVAVVAAVFAVLIGAGVWWSVGRGSDDSDPPGSMKLIAVVVEDRTEIGRIALQIEPAAGGRNTMYVEVEPADGSRLAGIDSVEIDLVSHTFPDDRQTLEIDLDDDGRSEPTSVTLSDQQYLQVDVRIPGDATSASAATFIFLVPDPNVHGMESFETVERDVDAEILYERALAELTSLNRVRYVQPLADGLNGAVVSYREVNDGSDGTAAGFTYFTPGGLDAVVIEDEMWTRNPGEQWRVGESNPLVPPSEWGEEYEGAIGFQFGPELALSNGDCRVVTFVVPEVEQRAVAWYSWCIDEDSGYVLRDAMIARNHYMITDYSDFNGDIEIAPPVLEEGATPVARQ